jgi:phosphocarrier protein HPr
VDTIKRTTQLECVRRVKVKNDLGLHTRPATVIVRMLHKSKSQITFTHRKETVNAKSILSLLMLAAGKNTSITIRVKGEDAEETADALTEAFSNKFGES